MRRSHLFSSFLALTVAAGLLSIPVLSAQEPPEKKEPEKQEKKPQKPQRPITEGLPQREMSEKERQRREEAIRKEMESHYKKWLEEDVTYIIMAEEREAFKHLNTDEEREQFIEQFWLRRDPTPDTIENESREEHYRRIAYANERFASGIPGWKTDRGRIYIMHGEPAEIESYPAGGSYQRTPEEGGGSTSVYPFERWRYRYIEGVGTDIILEFVDTSGSGEYRLTMDPSEKDALTLVPGAGLSTLEAMGLASKTDRFTRSDGTRMPEAVGGRSVRFEQFERLSQFANVQKPPPVKFKDLEALVDTRISFNLLPYEVRVDYVRITDETVYVPITIGLKNRDMTFEMNDGLHEATVNVFGRINTLTGRIVQTFEDVIQLPVPASLLEQTVNQTSVYQKTVPLRPGLYKLHLVLKDLASGNVGTREVRLAVPRFEEEQLAHSSLILADRLERVATRNVGSGQFVIGNTKVRPTVEGEFNPQDKLGIYLQVYNLGMDDTTHRPDAEINYTITKGSDTVFEHTETTNDLERAGQQITLEKLLPLASFQPGEYKLAIKVTDRVRQQTVTPSTSFRIVK